MRSVFARRTLLASHLIAGRRAAALPAVSSLARRENSLVVAEAAAFWLARRSYVASQEILAPSPSDLAVGLAVEREAAAEEEEEEEDGPMNEFLSRFAAMMREKLPAAYPESSNETIDGMLLVIAQKVVSEMEKGGGVLPSVGLSDPSLDLSPDLWNTVWEVSKSAFEETRRTRRREEMKRFLHCEDVKKMCRFASEIGIRGDMLRELRFQWAHEKLEEFDFYRNLERLREKHHRAEEIEKGGIAAAGDGLEARPSLTALPERRGKIKYSIHGLDLSAPSWADVSDKIHDAEKRDTSEELQPIMGKCKLVAQDILSLKEEEDPSPLLTKWADLLRPKRADWLALLEKIHHQNPFVYFKVGELVLDEESFEASIGDYAKLMDAYAKTNKVEDAERVLEKMREKGINADVRVWIILHQMYCDAGNLERAKEAFEKLRSEGFRADLKTYRSMIIAYVNAGHSKPAEALMREMEAREIKPTLELYRILLEAFARKGLVDSAQRMFNNMQFSGVQPDLEASTLLLEAYAQAGDADQARHSFDFLRKAGHKPDDRCMASMIAAYQKKNLLDKALDLLLTMENDGFAPGIATFSVLVDWLGRLLLVDEVEQIVERICEMGEDVPFKVNVSLCSMYARAGMKEKASKLLRRVEEEREMMMNADQYERIIDGFIAGGFHEDAKRIHGLMHDRGFAASESLRIALMSSPIVSRRSS